MARAYSNSVPLTDEQRQSMRERSHATARRNLQGKPSVIRTRKFCPMCFRNRMIKFFNIAIHQPDCLRPYCKDCDQAYATRWRDKHPDWAPNHDPNRERRRKFLSKRVIARIRARILGYSKKAAAAG